MTESAASLPGRGPVRARSGPDRVTVMLATLAVFLTVLSVLAGRLRTAAPVAVPAHHVLVVRRIYQTTIVDDRGSARRASAPSVSVSTSGGTAMSATPATRTSPSR